MMRVEQGVHEWRRENMDDESRGRSASMEEGEQGRRINIEEGVHGWEV